MDELRYADVAVDAPVGHARTFTYGIPARFAVQPGQLVWVPFGSQTLQGIVVALSAAEPDFPTRDILQIVEPAPLLGPGLLQLGQWLSRYYRSPLFDALSLMLPPGFESRVRSRILPVPPIIPENPVPANSEPPRGREETVTALRTLSDKGPMSQAAFVKLLGRRGVRELNRLVEQGEVRREATIPRPSVIPKYEGYLMPAPPGGSEPASYLSPEPASSVSHEPASPVSPEPASPVSPESGPPVNPEPVEGPPGLTPRQQALLDAVRQPPGHLSIGEANREFGPHVVEALWRKGLVAQEWWRTSGGPPPIPALGSADGPEQLTLTTEQRRALSEITAALDASFDKLRMNVPTGTPDKITDKTGTSGSAYPLSSRSFLLHGVTGSGKTEVYLRAIAYAVRLGRRAVFLVPEISLTPQTLERVNAWFAGRVALLHSQQTPRQRFDQWWDIRGGNFDVVVGPRSALFAPVDNLGIIVIDEEHEWTYKQEESAPLYHARAAALELARRSGAVVVLGSATPSVESYYHASRGRLRLLELPNRVAGGTAFRQAQGQRAEEAPGKQAVILSEAKNPSHEGETSDDRSAYPGLARVEICDMRQELRQGNRHIFSRVLSAGLRECLDSGNQAILFLNRRGSSSIVQCRDCGYVAVCRRCDTPLTYHAAPTRLLCHQCNYSRRPLTQCPECRGSRIRQLGLGTQRVVDEVVGLFPGIRVDRLDSDALRQAQGKRGGAGAAEEAVARLASGETQVLVGTQMVAKGLDIPNVALVGVVLADIGLHVPDFRAGERAFSLLCQVAGRAGRGDAPGRVFIQTYDPEHYAIRAGANQDYSEMYRQEIESRRRLGYPPFNQLAHIVYQNADADACQRQTTAIADELKRRAAAEGRTDIEVNGPAPGLPPRLRGRHRWRLLLRGRNLAEFLDTTDFPAGCTVDIDPAHVV